MVDTGAFVVHFLHLKANVCLRNVLEIKMGAFLVKQLVSERSDGQWVIGRLVELRKICSAPLHCHGLAIDDEALFGAILCVLFVNCIDAISAIPVCFCVCGKDFACISGKVSVIANIDGRAALFLVFVLCPGKPTAQVGASLFVKNHLAKFVSADEQLAHVRVREAAKQSVWLV